MSIKSLFEDIADAIREKSGSSDTYTPAEMPSAIRSIPSGSSTASGVSYDNTSSGLTANNVQDAIDELSGDVSTINSDLSELKTTDVSNKFTVNTTNTQFFKALKTGNVIHIEFGTNQLSASAWQLLATTTDASLMPTTTAVSATLSSTVNSYGRVEMRSAGTIELYSGTATSFRGSLTYIVG